MLTSFGQLAPQTRFHIANQSFPHFIKVADHHADVWPNHRGHSLAPQCGWFEPQDSLEVVTFDDLPLHVRVNRGLTDIRTAMMELARKFPALRGFWHGDMAEWNPDSLCSTAGKFSSGEIAVARFLLTLWNPGVRWKCGVFKFVPEVANMDPADRAVLAEWLLNPWWP